MDKALSSMRHSQIYVWEPKALQELEKFWLRPSNEKRFRDLCYNGRDLRYIPSLFDTAFHCCPADGFYCDQAMVPDSLAEPWTEVIFRPTTRVISVSTCVQDGVTYLPTILGTTHLYVKRVGITNWTKIEQQIASMPRRNLMRSTIVQFTAESRFPAVRDGMIFSRQPLDWLAKLYQMRIFLEQPYVGPLRVRPPKRDSRSTGLFIRETMEVVKVQMREPVPRVVPKVFFPAISRLTGRPLEFEIEVRSHARHCASGLVVQVKAHSRGPKGVRRERVVKVIR